MPQETIANYVKSWGPLAPIVFILIYQINIIIAPINGFPLLIVGFLLFGKNTVPIVYMATILGSSINFYISKRWGRPVVGKLAGEDALIKIDKLAKEYGVGTLFILRFFLIGLGDFIAYAYGLTRIKYSTFILVSGIAIIPSHIIWYKMASKVSNIEQFLSISLALTFIASGIFILGNYLYRRRKNLV